MPDEPRRLDSWKEIAGYLRRDLRTVARWERQRGLPVHRVPGGRLARVFAYPKELDEWLACGGARTRTGGATNGNRGEREDAPVVQEAPAPPPGTRLERPAALAAIGVLLVAALVLAFRLTAASGVPQVFVSAGNEFRALDALGRTRWTYRPGGPIGGAPVRTLIADLEGHGRDDMLAVLPVMRPRMHGYASELLRFESNGRARWSFTVDDRIAFRDGEYGPPWVSDNAGPIVYRVADENRLGWVSHHFTWWPGLFITLDAEGRRLATFVNSGWLGNAAPTADGRHLILTGVSNSWRAYIVAVLDAARPAGRSPEPPGSGTECVGCPPGDPLKYYVLPRTDVSRAQAFPSATLPGVGIFGGGAMQVRGVEGSGAASLPETIYELSADLHLTHARFSDAFWEQHALLEQQGALAHGGDACPHRQGLEVRQWSPGRGWESQQVIVR